MANNEKYDDDYSQDVPASAKSLQGYKVVVALLAVILVAVSGLYFYQSWRQKQDFAAEREILMGDMQALSNDYAGLQTSNDSLNTRIVEERMRTDSVLVALANERNVSRATIRRYEKELGTMRTIMAGYISTIDSLGKLNRRLIDENVGMRREITSERLRADMAEERANDADVKIRQGSRVIARDINLVALNSNDKEVTRVGRAARLRIDFTLSANDLANPGVRTIYARITGPDGYVLANPGAATFDFEGDPLVYSASREDVDYQNADLPISIYYRNSDIVAGNYKVEIFMDGLSIGSRQIAMR
jgi:hypothetical protein